MSLSPFCGHIFPLAHTYTNSLFFFLPFFLLFLSFFISFYIYITIYFFRSFLFTSLFSLLCINSNLRLTSGQHDVWCDKPMKNSDSSQQSWIFKQACMKHITSTRERYDRSIPPVEIYQSLPIISRRPVICKTTVVLDHFKFVGGIEDYLLLRAQQYKAKGLHWWAQSKALVDFVQRNDGKVCVSCPENHCDVTRLDEVTV